MLTYPQIDPIALAIGPLKIHWYGIMYLLAFAGAYGLALWRAREAERGWTAEHVSDLVFYGALGVILGGRIGYMLFYQADTLFSNPLSLFRVWEGGMSFHGGFIGVMLAMVLFARKYGKTAFQTLDFIAPCVPTGLMFGRLGNFINGELWGRPVVDQTYALAMKFPTGGDVLRHPSQLYEATFEGLVLFLVLWWFSSKPRPRMAVSALFLLGYGIARFGIEFFRQPDFDQHLWFGWMSKGQLLTVPMIVIGVWLFWYAYRRNVYDWGPRATQQKSQ
ncbi:prolipoprotein diacylglyceryl transferase [Aquirhabdus parva]|uniref:Phosphatidylglycerol--prolipoprotein diacylglyceryl transferase n=1 Tax=Aquirhabdus parva TaxID=2283318 RepID=A0A345P2N2_9GAMM|nr:prolipoprotein diacylglyceryl transferase [Aquirhabdus parva]AXI01541.1 prolipoprotein diacylglyceryl transferase [Aquirhabdus parva]